MVTRATRGINGYQWAYDNAYLLYQSDENGNEDYHLYSVDLKSSAIRDLTPFLVSALNRSCLRLRAPGEVLVSMNLRDSKVFDVYRVNLETGATIMDAQNPGDLIGWTADSNLVIRAATAFNDNLETVVRVRDNGKAPWRDLLKIPFEQAPFSGTGEWRKHHCRLFARTERSWSWDQARVRRLTALLNWNALTGKELRVLASDPKADLWQNFAASFVLCAISR